MSQQQIARLLGVHQTTVRSALVRHGLDPSPVRPGRALPDPRLGDEAWLRDKYEVEQMSQSALARLLSVDIKTVGLALRRAGVQRQPRRSRPALPPELDDREWLGARRVDEQLTIREIAVLAKTSPSSVLRALQRFGIAAPAARTPAARRSRRRAPRKAATGAATLAQARRMSRSLRQMAPR